ncbi:hypothetical protein PRIPAC_80280 [Pristionchus pacificus]|uniref:Uncharacterized protein n=1 Tax=Pristionchus pacificus TaxID=54126 RepID=A0A2A6CQ59_PRIPA|nr:hypothetical protein PRIPAC_80280 [Pristionchus pacificus]|eukprot:PDM80260.1 hypothetical protein PRIPAC_32839 [Pristionchus pacificus]
MAHLLILLALPYLASAAPSIKLEPGIGGGIGFGDTDKDNSPDLSGGVGVSLKPNWGLGSSLGGGIASALNGTVQSLADGHRAVDAAVIGSVANAVQSALDIISNSGGALGSAAAGVIGALGNATTALGNGIGPLNFGAGADAEVALKNAFGKYVGAVIAAGQNPAQIPNAVAALRDLIAVLVENGISGNGTVEAGPLGSVAAGGHLKEAINLLFGGILGGTL